MFNIVLSVSLLILAVLILVAGMIGCALIVWALIQMGKGEDEDDRKHK